MSANLSTLLYLAAGVLFILALRGLSHPVTSRQGNLYGMIGMGVAILTTLVGHPPSGGFAWLLVILGIWTGVVHPQSVGPVWGGRHGHAGIARLH